MDEQLATTLGNLAFLEAKSFAEMEYDLLPDCERATALLPAGAVLNATLSRAIQQGRARPDHILQTLYNRLLWIVDDFPALSPSLEWEQRLSGAGARSRPHFCENVPLRADVDR